MAVDAMEAPQRDGMPGDGWEGIAPPEVSPTAAVRLGWRVAELYAWVEDAGSPAHDTLLPAHETLDPADQLELQVRAAAGDARRAGVTGSGVLERLLPYARKAPCSTEAVERFRGEVRQCHVELDKALWAHDEAAGKAYELGNGISDTYSRIRRAYAGTKDEQRSTWESVFKRDRVERLKRLLDDLQSQLNSAGVAVVRNHLEVWCQSVPQRIRAGEDPPALDKVRGGLRRQSVIWHQLISGDKEPEAYLNSEARAEVRTELRRFVWKRYSAWIAPAAAILFALILFLPRIAGWYQDGPLGHGAAAAIFAIAGALGITKASVFLTVRTRVHQWSELLWHRALAKKVSDRTLVIDSVLPPPAPGRRAVAKAAAGIWGRIKPAVSLQPRPLRTPHTSF